MGCEIHDAKEKGLESRSRTPDNLLCVREYLTCHPVMLKGTLNVFAKGHDKMRRWDENGNDIE